MDRYILKDTLIPKERQQEISKRFLSLNDDNSLYLHFRRGIGINAFALPSGDIVISDELIKFSNGDMDMIYGVLAHEKGHVVHKHSMQLIIKASMVSAIIAYFTGDISSIVASLSTSILNANYTREFEKEADAYAKKNMLKNGIDPKHLANFFIKMSKKYKNSDKDSFFASHPSNKDRIEELLK
jgi:predicted Zn-dependent protease